MICELDITNGFLKEENLDKFKDSCSESRFIFMVLLKTTMVDQRAVKAEQNMNIISQQININ